MYLTWFLVIAGGIFYYRLGEKEYGQGFLSAAASVAISLVTRAGLGWGLVGFVAGQLALLAGMTFYNMRRHDAR
jgi:hypothetical protein